MASEPIYGTLLLWLLADCRRVTGVVVNFDLSKFWTVIENSRSASMKGQFGFQDEWQAAISQLKDADLAEAAKCAAECVKNVATLSVFEAYILHTSNNEDYGFATFCEWLVSHGEKAYADIIQNPDCLVSKQHPRCRWQETNLYQSVLMFIGIRSRFRPTVAIAQFQQAELQNPQLVLTRLVTSAVAPELADEINQIEDPKSIDYLLRLHLNVDKEQASKRLPNIAASLQAVANGRPVIDRRSPMNIEKFWQVMSMCRELGGTPLDLRSLLGLLPAQQVAQFQELLQACLANAAASPIAALALEDEDPIAWLFGLATFGRDAYRSAVATGTVPWRISRVQTEMFDVAPEVFQSQTGMELPALSIHFPSQIKAA